MNQSPQPIKWAQIQSIFPVFLATGEQKKNKFNCLQKRLQNQNQDIVIEFTPNSPVYQIINFSSPVQQSQSFRTPVSLDNKLLQQQSIHPSIKSSLQTSRCSVRNQKSIVYWVHKYSILRQQFKSEKINLYQFIEKLDKVFSSIKYLYENVYISSDYKTFQKIRQSPLPKSCKDNSKLRQSHAQGIKHSYLKPFQNQELKYIQRQQILKNQIISLKITISEQNETIMKLIKNKLQIEEKTKVKRQFFYNQIEQYIEQIQKIDQQNKQLKKKLENLKQKEINYKPDTIQSKIQMVLSKMNQFEQILQQQKRIKEKDQQKLSFKLNRLIKQNCQLKHKNDSLIQTLTIFNFQQKNQLGSESITKRQSYTKFGKSSIGVKRVMQNNEIESVKSQNKQILKMNVDLQLQVSNLKKKLKKFQMQTEELTQIINQAKRLSSIQVQSEYSQKNLGGQTQRTHYQKKSSMKNKLRQCKSQILFQQFSALKKNNY